VVFVDHATEYAVASDGPGDWEGTWAVVVVGCALVSGLVRSMIIVMPRIFGQDPGGVVLMIDQDTVGALGADGADEPLGIAVRSRGLRRCLDDRDVFAAEHSVECASELGIPVADEEAVVIRSLRSMARLRAV